MLRVALAAFLIGLLFHACAPRPQAPQDFFTDPTVDRVAEGILHFQSGDYSRAIRTFKGTIENYPGSPLLSEAQWMLARSYEATGRLEEAASEYSLFLQNYPENSHSSEARSRLKSLRQQSRSSGWVVGLRPDLSGDPEGMAGKIGDYEARGINTLVVPVFNRRGVLFASSLAPVDGDLLGMITAIAHARGMSVLAEISTREMGWLLRSHPEWEDRVYLPREKRLAPAGRPDLFNRQFWQYLTDLIRETRESDVDGVLLNLSIRREEGWTPSAIGDFKAAFGQEIAPAILAGKGSEKYPPVFWRWAGWRARRLAQYVGEMKSALDGFRWGVVLSEDAVRSPREGLVNSAQDLLSLRRLVFDYYIITSPPPEAMEDLEAKLKVFLPVPHQRLLGVSSASMARSSRLSNWGGVVAMTP